MKYDYRLSLSKGNLNLYDYEMMKEKLIELAIVFEYCFVDEYNKIRVFSFKSKEDRTLAKLIIFSNYKCEEYKTHKGYEI